MAENGETRTIRTDALARVDPPFDPASDRYAWLAERLPLEPTVEDEG